MWRMIIRLGVSVTLIGCNSSSSSVRDADAAGKAVKREQGTVPVMAYASCNLALVQAETDSD